MRIGELGKRVGLPPKTIRYYESIGLVPEPARSASGYREYQAEAEGRLRFIRAAKSIGLSLGEVREVLTFRDRGESPCRHVAGLIEAHARDLGERIEALEEMRRDLGRLARLARRTHPHADSEYCHIIEIGAVADAGRRQVAQHPKRGR